MKIKVSLLLFVFCLNAFSQTGEVDATFGTNGKVVTGFGTNWNTAHAVAFQPDGKFIVGGTYVSGRGDNDFALVRYNNNGTLDNAFGTAGKVVTNFSNNNYNTINSIYVLADGKIMAVGSTGMASLSTKLAVVRYHNDGSLDSSFGNNGKLVSTLIPYTAFGNKLVFQPDGKFLITSVKQYVSDPNLYFGIERYAADGTLDATFGTDGLASTSFGTGQSIPTAIEIQPDGKIIVAGRYQQTNARQIAIARFSADGAIDASFDGDGKAVTSFGNGTVSEAMHVAVNPDGKIILAGVVYTSPRNFALVQYNPNGSPDTSFDGDGKAMVALTDFYDNIASVTRQPDGKYLITIQWDFAPSHTELVARRYNSDVSPDTTFGTNGQVSATFGPGQNQAGAAGIAPDGKIVLVGKSAASDIGNFDFAIARYSTNGILDSSLDTDGKVITAFEKGNDLLSQLLVQPDDSFITVGTSGYRLSNNSTYKDIVLSKYHGDGTLDTVFGTSGKVVSVFGQNSNTVISAALQADGKIVVGNTYYNLSVDNLNHHELIRYNANGSLDTSFGTNGKTMVNFDPTYIAIQADGKIIIAGINPSANTGYSLCRFTAGGLLDTGFGNGGTVFVAVGNPYYGKISVLFQPDGGIIAAGSSSTPDVHGGAPVFAAIRFDPNGVLDTAFGTNGSATALIHDNCFAYRGFLQADGKLLIAGISFGGSVIYFSSVRFLANGTIDATYGTNGIASANLAYDYRIINNILLQPDGKFLVALSKYNQTPDSYDFKIRRFNPDGTFDNDFGGFTGVTTSFFNGYDEAFSIGLQSSHKIIAAGTTHNGITTDFAITRYTNTILAVPGFDSHSGLVLYPNPARDVLNVKAENDTCEILGFRLYNILGQMIDTVPQARTQIDTSALSSGIYTLQVQTSKGLVNKKFVRE